MTQRRMLANASLRVPLVTTVRDPESPATQSDVKTLVGDAHLRDPVPRRRVDLSSVG
jgi:hypothetical protein